VELEAEGFYGGADLFFLCFVVFIAQCGDENLSSYGLTTALTVHTMEVMERFASPFGIVELTSEREKHILSFHPEVRSQRKHFALTLAEPEIIRRSRFDPKAYVLYRAISQGKYIAVVVKTNHRSFILTAYLTRKIQQL
jgi:hypothetical protein